MILRAKRDCHATMISTVNDLRDSFLPSVPAEQFSPPPSTECTNEKTHTAGSRRHALLVAGASDRQART